MANDEDPTGTQAAGGGADATPEHCLNCGAPLAGPFCHACGQPVKGMIRQLRSVLGDFLDTVFEYDSRIWRTLIPLYFQPGRLTLDFMAGRRIRFVTPFRLAFVLLVVALLVLQLNVTAGEPVPNEPQRVTDAMTEAELEDARARTLEKIAQARQRLEGMDEPSAASRREALDQARVAAEQAADRRLEWIRAAESAQRAGRPPPPEPSHRPQIFFTGDTEPWHPERNPLRIAWLPAVANDTLNQWLDRALDNLAAADEDPSRLLDAFMGLLPAALFVLLPLFAGLLKLFYVRTGRLYMAHMVAALHSHAFLGLALIVATGFSAAADALPIGSWLETACRGLEGLALAWIPVHLLVMQRRVYAQGWPLTLAKFSAIGALYVVLLTTTVTIAALVTLIRG